MSMRGARYLHVLVPCPLGWGTATAQTINLARLAQRSGLFPLFEAEHGEVTSSVPIRGKVPVEEYLRPQKRYSHLFGDHATHRCHREAAGNRRPQHRPLRATGRGGLMDKPFAITLDVKSSLANHTGTWRSERPVYADGLPPCNHACPAGEQIQAWLYTAEDGSYEQAWRQLVNDNPFPAIMGRVCYHPCQTACNRAEVDSAVGINSVERFLGDEAIKQGWQLPAPAAPTGKRVLVVGSGPAGLSAAYQLRRQGHEVEIHEAFGQPGGMMRLGIPTFRLPRDILDIEIARLLELGITLKTDSPVTDLQATMQAGHFDAAFLAVGAQLSKRAYIPAGQAARILDALAVLGSVAGGERPELGRTVIVYGGGNTAMDAARTARRLGADDAIVVYRRTQAQMPANELELEEALDEGVQVKWLRTITQVGDGTMTLEKMRLDENGKPQPTGEFEELAGDAVILALGQDVDRSMLDTVPGVQIVDGVVQVDATMMTGCPGVFAGGDAVPSERSVTVGIGHGKAAARNINEWLRKAGGTSAAPSRQPRADHDRRS